jgi:hypothetical protein
MPTPLPKEISELFVDGSGGDREVFNQLMPLVYDELRSWLIVTWRLIRRPVLRSEQTIWGTQ